MKNPLAPIAKAVRGAFGRLGGRREVPSGSIVVVRRDSRKNDRQLAPVTGLWDRRFEDVQDIISTHERGRFRASGVLADVLDRNPRVMGALNNRTLGVLAAPFSVLPSADADQRRARAVARALEADWPTMMPEHTSAQVLRWLCTMGYAVCRVRRVTARGRWLPALEPWHPSFIRWDDNTQTFMAQTMAGEAPVVPGQGWVVFAAAAMWPWMRGVVRCLGLSAETRSFAVRDWARWSEKHGQPWIELQVPASKAESDESEEFFQQMREIGQESVIVSPQGDGETASFGVNLIEAKDTAWEGFKELIARQDGDISIAIEGQNLTTENTGTGTYASSKVGRSGKQDLCEADAWLYATTIHEQLLPVWAGWNFGDPSLAPWAVYDPTPPEDLVLVADTMTKGAAALSAWRPLLQSVGKDVDIVAFAERFGVPLVDAPPDADPALPAPDEGEDDDPSEEPSTRARKRRARAFLSHRPVLL